MENNGSPRVVVTKYKKYFLYLVSANAITLGQQSPEIAYWLGFNPRLEINFEANSDRSIN